jgi:hypothetical protein
MTLDIRKRRQERAKATRSQLVGRECRMGLKCTIISFFLLITSIFASCGIWQKSDIEGRLISEMAGNCKKVQIKRDYAQEVYVIAYTGKVSKDGCPVALLQGWKGERLIKEKELEICGCKEAKGK